MATLQSLRTSNAYDELASYVAGDVVYFENTFFTATESVSDVAPIADGVVAEEWVFSTLADLVEAGLELDPFPYNKFQTVDETGVERHRRLRHLGNI